MPYSEARAVSGQGATRVAPNSHRWDRDKVIPEEAAVRAEMTAGSVLLWLGAVAHGASSSTGTSVEEGKRKGVLLIYNQGW